MFNSEFVKQFADGKVKEAEATFMKKVLENDSTKRNFITQLGIETGLRDEVVQQKFQEMFKLFINGQLLTEEQVKELIRTRRVTADF